MIKMLEMKTWVDLTQAQPELLGPFFVQPKEKKGKNIYIKPK